MFLITTIFKISSFKDYLDLLEDPIIAKIISCVKELLLLLTLIAFDHFDILASDTNKLRLLTKESSLIKQNHEVISIKTILLKNFLTDFHRTKACCYEILTLIKSVL